MSPAQVAHEGPQSLSVGSTSLMTVTSGGPSNHSRVSSPTHRRNTELTSSFRSSHSGHSSLATVSLNTATMGTGIRHLEGQLRLRFSGGAGFQEGFCRQVSAVVPLELLPSAHITNWDVLPAEIPSQFYLVLDVVNVTGQEMALQYTEQKNIVIEAKESCRIPVPVERCPLEKIQAGLPNESGSMVSGHEVDQIEKICSRHIADQVDLRWSLVGTETKGLASLKGITLSPADIQCSAQNSQMVSISSHAAESTSSAGAGSSVGGHTVNTTGSLSGHRNSSDAHIWRFTPPIEVTVVE
uniref:Trs120/TRAPPC9 third Ig-like domain-containing protein n=1 Tax=Phlebotomus papatasi TaxID=29031 RepID=A0A1B0DMT0_PHLPP